VPGGAPRRETEVFVVLDIDTEAHLAGDGASLRWPSLRAFLEVPAALSGQGERIAVGDGTFAPHPDVSTDVRRRSYHVLAAGADPQPVPLDPEPGPWTGSAQHGVWAAAAAAGSGALSGGEYAGVAPEAELYLVAGWLRGVTPDSQARTEAALRWLLRHGKAHGIRGVVPCTQSGPFGTGLLPWQLDPIRVLGEQLATAGFLVVVGTGNLDDLTCDVTQAQAPSALAVGGVAMPAAGAGTWGAAPPYHCSRGTTFEDRWVPDLLAPAENLVLPLLGSEEQQQAVYDGPDYGDVPPGYIRTNGTSFAGPAVLGAAACVWQAHPNWTAAQVRAVLVATARHRPQWAPLRAGLVSVAAAVEATPVPDPLHAAAGAAGHEIPYARYRRWRDAGEAARLRAIAGSDGAVAEDALLAFLPASGEPLSHRAVEAIRRLLSGGSQVTNMTTTPPQFRAGALCVLASQPQALAAREIEDGLIHGDPRVRAAALYALGQCRQHWDELVPALAARFGDDSPDVRQAAFRVAGQIGDQTLVQPLVAGLAEDVARRRLACYVARRGALAAITGVQIPEQPVWRPGESPSSDHRWTARSQVASAWEAWLAAGNAEPVKGED
jgi:serine protease AprX